MKIRERKGLERRHEIFSAAVQSVSAVRPCVIFMQFTKNGAVLCY